MHTDNSNKFRRRIRGYIKRMSSQIDELAGECNQWKRNTRKKMIQRKELVNVYKQNLILRVENRKLFEDLYLAKKILRKKNLAIFLKETSFYGSLSHGD
jgi:oligoribonuclease NrnB/cAMP/cGMP phosphodiesterase (DHH superfamily)